ncbi:hypothetical protein, partial [Paenibacillus naphthalenovorans]|uniref:hypothetical protein n=1 Tax=Paenibacillus naphthalenovorans TaxID=162209 RepID=UPI003D2A53EE
IYYWRESIDSLSLHSLVVQFSKGNFTAKTLLYKDFSTLSLVVTSFSGDFYNIPYSPISMQAFF